MVAAIGNGAAFTKGRNFAAWLGLVPKQMSTGDRTILGRITRRGNSYLRTLFVLAARSVLMHPASWPKHGFGPWLAQAAQRLHRNVLVTALANKLACDPHFIQHDQWRHAGPLGTRASERRWLREDGFTQACLQSPTSPYA